MLEALDVSRRRIARKRKARALWAPQDRRGLGLSRSAAARLAGVGVTPEMVTPLPNGGARSLARWSDIRVSRGQNLAVFLVALSYGPIIAMLLEIHDWPRFIFWSGVIGIVLYPLFRLGAPQLLERAFRGLDNYREYGQSGFRLIHALQDSGVLRGSGRMDLKQIEIAIRAAHTWKRLGTGNGADKAWRTRRVFDLLARYPLDAETAAEICVLIRSSLVETVGARIDPFTYREQRGFWRHNPRFELANSMMALVAAALSILVAIVPVVFNR